MIYLLIYLFGAACCLELIRLNNRNKNNSQLYGTWAFLSWVFIIVFLSVLFVDLIFNQYSQVTKYLNRKVQYNQVTKKPLRRNRRPLKLQ